MLSVLTGCEREAFGKRFFFLLLGGGGGIEIFLEVLEVRFLEVVRGFF